MSQKRILITGGAGFLGLVDSFKIKNIEVAPSILWWSSFQKIAWETVITNLGLIMYPVLKVKYYPLLSWKIDTILPTKWLGYLIKF